MGICWTMAEFTTVAEGRSAERGEARRAEAIYKTKSATNKEKREIICLDLHTDTAQHIFWFL